MLQDRATRARGHRAGVAGRVRRPTRPTRCRSRCSATCSHASGPPPHGSSITYEPGGQLELSSPAFRGATACWQALPRTRTTCGGPRRRRHRAPARPPSTRTARPAASWPIPATTRWRPTSRPSARRHGPGDDDQHRRPAGQPRHRRRPRGRLPPLVAAARHRPRRWSRPSPTPPCTPAWTPAGSPPGSGSGSTSTTAHARAGRRRPGHRLGGLRPRRAPDARAAATATTGPSSPAPRSATGWSARTGPAPRTSRCT